MNALVVIEALTPAVYADPNGIETLIANLEAKVRAIETDISTSQGRAAIKSLAHQVSRSKTALDEMGKDLVADLKKQTGAVDAERKKIRDRLDTLRDEVRQPLTDWEDTEEQRVAGHRAEIQRISDLVVFTVDRPTVAQIGARLAEIEALPAREWQEFDRTAKAACRDAFAKLTVMKASAVAYEAEQAELTRLRAEQAEREQRDREARIAADAAAKATRDAEAKAARDAQEAEARATEAQRKADRDRADAVARAEQAERAALEAATKAERDRKAAAEKAESDRLAAIEAERRRVADLAAAEATETARREADKAHRKAINSEALAAFVANGLTTEQGIAAITAIVRGAIPHIKVTY